MAPLGLVAGFLDAAGGGGWGPISTPSLLSSGRMEPRKVVGTVDTSEFVVAMCASVGFLISLSFAEIPLSIVAALLIGGVIAAPLAAWLVRHLHPRVLGTAVGGVILLTNARTFLKAIGVDPGTNHFVYAVILVIWAIALYFAFSIAPGFEAGARQLTTLSCLRRVHYGARRNNGRFLGRGRMQDNERGFTLWFTGLSGAGKTTIAEIVEKELRERGRRVEVLDGDIVRTNLSKGLGFSREDRNTNVLRIGFVANLLTRNGVAVIVSAISPYKEPRDQVRRRIIDFV